MLSLHGLGAAGEGAAGYYTALARDDYYTQGGEPAGHWFGQGAVALGLSGTVDETALRHVLHGFDGAGATARVQGCLLYTSPSPRDGLLSRMPSSA